MQFGGSQSPGGGKRSTPLTVALFWLARCLWGMKIYVWMQQVLTIWEHVGYIAVFCQLVFLGRGSCALTWPSCLGLCRYPGFACIWSVGAFMVL